MKPSTPPRLSAPPPRGAYPLIWLLLALSVTACATPSTSPSTPSVAVVTCPPPPKMPAPLEAQPSQPYLTTWRAKLKGWQEQLQDTPPTR